MAKELNIGLDSFVFVDDNPTERELVKQMLPMVAVPEFPEQPYELPIFFKELVERYFKIYSITDEDKKKTEQYKANAARLEAQQSFADFDKFLESLEIQIDIEQANEFNIPRKKPINLILQQNVIPIRIYIIFWLKVVKFGASVFRISLVITALQERLL